jgi:hypothetical protein
MAAVARTALLPATAGRDAWIAAGGQLGGTGGEVAAAAGTRSRGTSTAAAAGSGRRPPLPTRTMDSPRAR